MQYVDLFEECPAGPDLITQAVAGMTAAQLDSVPIAGKWSIRQVVCHIADFEPVYTDRMKRVIAEDQPAFFGGAPDVFAARLAYPQRDVEVELHVIAATRSQMIRILRTGIHSEVGSMTLKT